jgi:nucleoid DNA-binding protein
MKEIIQVRAEKVPKFVPGKSLREKVGEGRVINSK